MVIQDSNRMDMSTHAVRMDMNRDSMCLKPKTMRGNMYIYRQYDYNFNVNIITEPKQKGVWAICSGYHASHINDAGPSKIWAETSRL